MKPEDGPLSAAALVVQRALVAQAEAKRAIETGQRYVGANRVAVESAQRVVASMNKAAAPSLAGIRVMQQAALVTSLIQTPIVHCLPPVADQRDRRIRKLEARVHDLEGQVPDLEARVGRKLGGVEAEGAMAWAVLDQANEEEPPEGDAEAPRDQEPD